MRADVDDGGRRTADPFGSTVGERLWRRLAGAAVGVMPAGGLVLALWPTAELLPWVVLGAAVVYVLGVPVSWFLTRRGGEPVGRHVLAAAVVSVLVAAVLSLPGDVFTSWWAFFSAVALSVGVPIAALAAWAGVRLPPRAVRPVAVAGLVVAVLALPLATWVAHRPPAPYDFVVVHEPDAVRAESAYELAETLAERFERRAAAGQSRTAHSTWVAVGDGLSAGTLGGVAHGQRLTPDDELPTLRESGQPVRLITIVFDGEPSRGCVVLTPDRSWAEPQACADLDLTG